MKKLFNQVVDINGNTCKYPVAEDGSAFCFTRDGKYCIYALYTKRDLTGSAIIEVSYDTYSREYAAFQNLYKKEPLVLFLSSIEAVKGITSFAKYKATVDNTTVGELLDLEDKGENN